MLNGPFIHLFLLHLFLNIICIRTWVCLKTKWQRTKIHHYVLLSLLIAIHILSLCSSIIFNLPIIYFFSGPELSLSYTFQTLKSICRGFCKWVFISIACITGSIGKHVLELVEWINEWIDMWINVILQLETDSSKGSRDSGIFWRALEQFLLPSPSHNHITIAKDTAFSELQVSW